jgi:hypothetical protein
MAATDTGFPRTARGAPSAGTHPRVSTRQLAFTVPFQVGTAPGGQQPSEVRLYVSSDRGQTWQLYARQSPGAEKFAFRASADGAYLFLVRTVDRFGRMYPAGPAQPELEVVVDTQEPKLMVQASVGESGELKANWTIIDSQLAPDTFSLQFQTAPDGPWQTLAVQPPAPTAIAGQHGGSTMWWSPSPVEAVRIRAQVRDHAGNLAVVHDTIDIPRVVARPTGDVEPPAKRGTPATPVSTQTGNGYPQTPYREVRPPAESTSTAEAPAGAATTADSGAAPPAPKPKEKKGIHWPVTSESGTANWSGDPPAAAPPVAQRPQTTGHPSGPRIAATDSSTDSQRHPARRDEPTAPTRTVSTAIPSARGALDTTGLPAGEQPNMTRARRFQLEYDVDSVGPSGVRRVELWQTRDAGRTWQPVAVDDDNRSPIIVEPPEEGIYGYRIVVESGNGLTGPPPQSGDVAEIWIGVDWTRPTAELTSAIYGSGEKAGELEVHWQAKDARLARRPVSLLFSDTPGGPWSPIASGLPNNGVYHWRVDSRVPNEIHLRLEVRDEAGNMAAHELQRPIPNDGLVPQGRIRGLHSTEDAPGRGN